MAQLLVILGPTASGKTKLAAHLATHLDGEIISADSRQVYRGMSLGTGKDLEEYIINGQSIPYHLIDIVEAGDAYNVYRFQQDFQTAYQEIKSRNRTPILCGGSGLYIEAVLKQHQFTAIPINEPLREILAQQTNEQLLQLFHETPSDYKPLADISTRKRLIRAIEMNTYLHHNPLPYFPSSTLHSAPIFGLILPVEVRRERITKRLHQRLKDGLIDEVQTLLNRGVAAEKLIYYGLEYKFITEYLLGTLDYHTMTERLNVAIHQFAKRQMTFFRKMERDGLVIEWLDALLPTNELVERIKLKLENYNNRTDEKL
ncbi:MAG: tRNA (adenosine(37)-N6)-dimethylallyltransferase MiaA [Spirosomataceae bacterium]